MDKSLVNPSFLLAIAVGILGGYLLGIPVGRLLVNVSGFSRPFLLQSFIAIIIAILYVLWVFHNTPTRNKTAVLFLGTKRVRMGPGGRGFEEGLNAMPLGWPFFIPVDKNTGESTEEFEQMKAYSKDMQPVEIEGTYNIYIDDIYATYNIQSEDEAKQAIISMVRKWVRAAAENYDAEELISQEANGGGPIKVILAKKALVNIQAELASDYAAWGYNVRQTLQVSEIKLDPDFEKTLKNIKREEVEGRAEKIQIERRLEQIQTLRDKGLNPDLAAAIAQVEAEKPGAKINTFNIPGTQGIGEGVGNFAKAAAEWLQKKTPS